LTPPIPDREPIQFVAGDTVKWTRVVADYPAVDGWTLNYKIVGPRALVSQPAVSVVDGVFTVTLAASATAGAAFAAGTYRIIGYVDGVGAERHTVYEGVVEILPNVAELSHTSLLTHEERMLTAIQAALEGRTTADIEAYTIDGTQITKLPMERLLQLQGIYKVKVWRLRNPGKSVPMHAIRFGSADENTNAAESLAWPGYRP
jgi:hypothetical protein